jgi:hypothetical protein
MVWKNEVRFSVLPLQPWKWREYVPLKSWQLPTSLHGAKTQKNIIICILVCVLLLKWLVFIYSFLWIFSNLCSFSVLVFACCHFFLPFLRCFSFFISSAYSVIWLLNMRRNQVINKHMTNGQICGAVAVHWITDAQLSRSTNDSPRLWLIDTLCPQRLCTVILFCPEFNILYLATSTN